MKRSLLIFTFLVFISNLIYSQQFMVSGIVKDKQTGEPLSFATVRVINSSYGISTNKEGEYELKLKKGKYSLAVSFLGYHSDTLRIDLSKNTNKIDFNLIPTNVNLPEVTVLPGVNPAIQVIKNAIKAKKLRAEKLHSYQFEAYTKGVVRTPDDFRVKGSNASLGFGSVNDSTKLKITGILENLSKGYFKKPGKYKDVVIARKQSANFPPSVNTITGGRFIQNFYEETIPFVGGPLKGPIADDALDYYYYKIEDTLAMDKQNVFKISITPDDPSDPGFTGLLYIADNSFDLIKVDLNMNRAANTGGFFDSVNVVQQFSSYADDILMPTDYRMFLSITFLKLAKIAFEMNTSLYDYQINGNIEDSFFDKAILTVLPEADKKDSLYWTKIQTIQSTMEETKAYERIDSIEKAPRTFWDNFSFLSTRFSITDNVSATAPLGLYNFNRVEGHSLNYGFYLSSALENRLNSSIDFSYGFSDKKFKTDFSGSYLLGEYRTHRISALAFDKLTVLFENADNYNDLTSTVLALFTKYEYRDYYYTKGFNLSYYGDVFQSLSLGAGIFSATDKNGYNNTDFSFFYKDRKFKDNPPITEVKINAITARFNFDYRDYIEDGLYRRKVSLGKSYFTLGGSIIYSDKNTLKSEMDFTKYRLNSFLFIKSFGTTSASFTIKAEYTDGTLPYQMLYSLPGNINSVSRGNSFRTLDINEVLGDRVVTLFFDHSFGSELFRMSGIPYLKDSELRLNYFINAAYSELKNRSKEVPPAQTKTFLHPFFETGFSLGHVWFPMQLEFAWKLNYRDGNNFRISLNSAIF